VTVCAPSVCNYLRTTPVTMSRRRPTVSSAAAGSTSDYARIDGDSPRDGNQRRNPRGPSQSRLRHLRIIRELGIRRSTCQTRAKPHGSRGSGTVTPGKTRMHDLHRRQTQLAVPTRQAAFQS
jgi:hypothetical protein